MGACDEMTTKPQEEEINFHKPPAIAALLTILLRNSANSERDFVNFECQMNQTLALAVYLESSKVKGADTFLTIAQHVKALYEESDENKALFTKAHEAIRDLLVMLPKGGWGPCNYVSHSTIEQIMTLE